MLYIIGKHLADQGHDVTIFSSQPGYNDAYDGPKLPRREQVDGMTVIRTWLLKENKKNAIVRSINFAIFSISLFIHAVFRGKAYDTMTVTTFPPGIMATVARTIGLFRKTDYIYHCMDLYPELAEASGILKRKWLAKFSLMLDKRNCRKAKAVIVLSDDMKQTLAKRDIDTSNVHIINNFIIDSFDGDVEACNLPEGIRNRDEKFRVLFAGNIGRFQSLDTVVDAALQIAQNGDSDMKKNLEFWFVGSGLMVDQLRQQAGDELDKSIFFHPYLPIDQVMGVIAESNLGIVSLVKGVIQSAYPSKTMTYLEAGCRLLTLVEVECELAKFVTQENVGVVCGEVSAAKLAELIVDEYRRCKAGEHDRQNVRDVGRRNFGQPAILNEWTKLLAP